MAAVAARKSGALLGPKGKHLRHGMACRASGTSDGRRQLAISADGGVSSSAGLSGELVGSQAATPDVAARWTPDDLSAAQTALINIESIEESAFDRPSSGARPYEAVIDTIFGDPEQDGDLADRSHVAVAAATAHLRAIAAGREEEGDLSLDGLLDAALTSTSSSAGPRVVTPGSLLSSLLPRGPPSFRRALPGPARSLRPRVGLFDAPLCSPQGVAAWTELFTRALGSGRFLHLEEGVRTLLNRTPGASERLGVPLRVRTPSGRAVRPGVLPPGHHPDHHCSAIGIAAGGVRFSAGGARHADHIARAVPTGFDDVVESALAGTPLPVTRVVYDDVTSFPISVFMNEAAMSLVGTTCSTIYLRFVSAGCVLPVPVCHSVFHATELANIMYGPTGRIRSMTTFLLDVRFEPKPLHPALDLNVAKRIGKAILRQPHHFADAITHISDECAPAAEAAPALGTDSALRLPTWDRARDLLVAGLRSALDAEDDPFLRVAIASTLADRVPPVPHSDASERTQQPRAPGQLGFVDRAGEAIVRAAKAYLASVPPAGDDPPADLPASPASSGAATTSATETGRAPWEPPHDPRFPKVVFTHEESPDVAPRFEDTEEFQFQEAFCRTEAALQERLGLEAQLRGKPLGAGEAATLRTQTPASASGALRSPSGLRQARVECWATHGGGTAPAGKPFPERCVEAAHAHMGGGSDSHGGVSAPHAPPHDDQAVWCDMGEDCMPRPGLTDFEFGGAKKCSVAAGGGPRAGAPASHGGASGSSSQAAGGDEAAGGCASAAGCGGTDGERCNGEEAGRPSASSSDSSAGAAVSQCTTGPTVPSCDDSDRRYLPVFEQSLPNPQGFRLRLAWPTGIFGLDRPKAPHAEALKREQAQWCPDGATPCAAPSSGQAGRAPAARASRASASEGARAAEMCCETAFAISPGWGLITTMEPFVPLAKVLEFALSARAAAIRAAEQRRRGVDAAQLEVLHKCDAMRDAASSPFAAPLCVFKAALKFPKLADARRIVRSRVVAAASSPAAGANGGNGAAMPLRPLAGGGAAAGAAAASAAGPPLASAAAAASAPPRLLPVRPSGLDAIYGSPVPGRVDDGTPSAPAFGLAAAPHRREGSVSSPGPLEAPPSAHERRRTTAEDDGDDDAMSVAMSRLSLASSAAEFDLFSQDPASGQAGGMSPMFGNGDGGLEWRGQPLAAALSSGSSDGAGSPLPSFF
ncbi:hypothetical protein FNF27_08248 [Cafeteria roenbergensis]|uniref:Uncharacterized protein n=2 Tax=Cafeteria roenbergensis TaxID=33653 RepID=A0A5A8D5N7_CAFRO|nr:hypothetical protein FNF27_08248 [Cafeteria roenbergensis]